MAWNDYILVHKAMDYWEQERAEQREIVRRKAFYDDRIHSPLMKNVYFFHKPGEGFITQCLGERSDIERKSERQKRVNNLIHGMRTGEPGISVF